MHSTAEPQHMQAPALPAKQYIEACLARFACCHSMQAVLSSLVLPVMPALAMQLPGSKDASHLRLAADVTSLSGLGHSAWLCKVQAALQEHC